MMAHIRDDRQATIIAACVVCLTLACIAVILRFFARRLSNTRILWDDYMILVALVSNLHDAGAASIFHSWIVLISYI